MSGSTASRLIVLRGVFPGIRVATGHILRSAGEKVSAECIFCAQRSFLRRCYRKAVKCNPALEAKFKAMAPKDASGQ